MAVIAGKLVELLVIGVVKSGSMSSSTIISSSLSSMLASSKGEGSVGGFCDGLLG